MTPWSKQNDNNTLYIIIAAVALLIVVGFFLWRNSTTTSSPPVVKEEPKKAVKPPNPEHETPLVEDDIRSKPTFVMFYADWCGHSRSALPEWKKLEDALRGSPIACLALNDVQHKKEMMEHGIKGYPTIRMYPTGFPSSNFVDYPGPRTVEAMMTSLNLEGNPKNTIFTKNSIRK
jgi:thiol-disulfide isomerase/thioredoxin